jgi:hypothetical protein
MDVQNSDFQNHSGFPSFKWMSETAANKRLPRHMIKQIDRSEQEQRDEDQSVLTQARSTGT